MATIHQLKGFSNNEKKEKAKARQRKKGKVRRKKGSRKLKQNKQQTHP